ncbi:MAG TPA: ZIP family metal transporter [Polyangiaceae bacterium]|nr:ZIP family metal transporter [Polyangiaceae bacterium]
MVALWSFASVILVSLVSLVGVFALAWEEERMHRLARGVVGFAAGGLMGDAFFHLLPEAFSASAATLRLGFLLASGVLAFMVVEGLMRRLPAGARTSGSALRKLPPLAVVNLISDGLHNFLDGVVIGASYLESRSLGVATTLAVILHEIPQELGDFGILVSSGLTARRAIRLNFLCALTSLLGTAAALLVGGAVEGFSRAMLPFTAGGFLYIALADLLPELQSEPRTPRVMARQLALIASGLGVMAWLASAE